MGNAFTLAPEKLEALLLPVTDMSMVRMPAPVFLGTGLADRTVPPRRQYGAAAALCATGSPLVWKTYDGVTHNGIVNAAFDDELRFVRRALANELPESNCAAIAEPGLPGPVKAGIAFND